MTFQIRLAHFIEITTAKDTYRYQNYFVQQVKLSHEFAPFQVQGTVANLNGDNSQISILFPTTDYALSLVELGDGNRKSQLKLSTYKVTTADELSADPLSTEFYIGLGASLSEDSIELRFNTAIDSVAANFPARRFNAKNVGFLPLDSTLSLR